MDVDYSSGSDTPSDITEKAKAIISNMLPANSELVWTNFVNDNLRKNKKLINFPRYGVSLLKLNPSCFFVNYLAGNIYASIEMHKMSSIFHSTKVNLFWHFSFIFTDIKRYCKCLKLSCTNWNLHLLIPIRRFWNLKFRVLISISSVCLCHTFTDQWLFELSNFHSECTISNTWGWTCDQC